VKSKGARVPAKFPGPGFQINKDNGGDIEVLGNPIFPIAATPADGRFVAAREYDSSTPDPLVADVVSREVF
jgi:hypothetical protein